MADTMSNVKLVIYKKIVDGDLRKFSATSNDQPSGGGARDLRFSPAKDFFTSICLGRSRRYRYRDPHTYKISIERNLDWLHK